MIRNLWDEAENSRAATSRVAALRELRKIFESKKPEPEPPVGNPRVHDLAAVLRLAEQAGVDVTSRVPSPRLTGRHRSMSASYAEALLFDDAPGRDATAEAGTRPDSESTAETSSVDESRPDDVVAVEGTSSPDVSGHSSGPSGPAIYDDFGRWALIVDGAEAADLRRQEFEAAQREGERLTGGWVDPDLPSPLRPNGNEAA